MTIYLISGLGAGEEIFKYLKFPHPIHFLPWIPHLKNETLREYSKRMSKKIDQSKPFILIGVSFGGIVAQEIATFSQPQKVIIISSVKSRSEIPLYIRLSAKWHLFSLMPNIRMNWSKSIVHFLFGAKKKGEKKFLDEILDRINVSYLKWCLNQIGNWKPKSFDSELVHIHGKKDFLFPSKNIKSVDFWLEGGHFIVMQEAKYISLQIAQFIK